ncbi:MAG: ATP-binding cassette domain-containing protein, partial [Clostridiales bacterium]|nr:ATP-binding cassette domain-containing protein [Clostridiales bacterium]
GETLYSFVLQAFSHLMAQEKRITELQNKLIAGGKDASKLTQRLTEEYETFTRDGGLTFRARTRSALAGLGYSPEDQARDITTFSGGQVEKAALARTLLRGADLLLLDEPTNHLDIDAARWLENYLLGYKGAVLAISHDRRFLDLIAQRIFELEHGHLRTGRGNYTTYREKKLSAREIEQRHYLATQKEIRRIEGIITQQRRWNRERNFITIASKQKQIDRLRDTLKPPEKDPAAITFSFHAPEPLTDDILIAEDMGKAFTETPLFANVNLHIRKGETVCLVGPNGCGKTTLLKMLAGLEPPDQGLARLGANVRLGYYEQTAQGFDAGGTVLDTLSRAFPRMTSGELRSALALFLFRGDEIYKDTSILSGGERARIRLLKLMLAGSNLLLLDEPTNHLDIHSAQTLERALEHYTGTTLLVTHDRYLIEKLADRVLYLAPDGLKELDFPFEEAYAALQIPDSRFQTPVGAICDRPLETKPDNPYLQRKQRNTKLLQAKQALKRAEQAVEENERQIAETTRQLEEDTTAGLYEKVATHCARLTELQTENEALYAQLEQAEQTLANVP